MKLTMKTFIAGTRNGVRWPQAGGVVDLPEGEARDLIAQGLADRVEETPVPAVKKAEKRPAAKKPEKR